MSCHSDDDNSIVLSDNDATEIIPECESTIKLSWGIELWDCYDDLSNHTKDGIDFLENEIGHFVKERGNIEKRYASELRSLIKKYTPKYSDKGDNEEYTYVQAYKEVSITLFFEYLFLVQKQFFFWYNEETNKKVQSSSYKKLDILSQNGDLILGNHSIS